MNTAFVSRIYIYRVHENTNRKYVWNKKLVMTLFPSNTKYLQSTMSFVAKK